MWIFSDKGVLWCLSLDAPPPLTFTCIEQNIHLCIPCWQCLFYLDPADKPLQYFVTDLMLFVTMWRTASAKFILSWKHARSVSFVCDIGLCLFYFHLTIISVATCIYFWGIIVKSNIISVFYHYTSKLYEYAIVLLSAWKIITFSCFHMLTWKFRPWVAVTWIN